ncbi:hypothetical protein H6763_02515 [Candidatus Nomurabacteria bacterium]|uniref:Uncharacterized protein n=1 Tax=Candidatus Dojkabacteria bacterium TaxID=2099670 RepID=A0A955I1P5_9BACT|nr:hypothetical protein [Candidatus Dojkabacteria bacterium]MCB9790392.1 hypothetical protein [Candidatus Nomurabacteria bacterium]MCB9803680.1 hypothetical protein [Candidatus Nomurabacteria bacterium]
MVSKSKQKKRSKNKQFELRMILLGIVSLTLFLVSLLIYLYKSESIIDKYNIIASDFSDSSFSISFSTLQPKYFQAVLLTEGEGISKLISSKATSETEDIRIIERVSDTFKPGYYTHYYTFKKIDPNESYRVALKDSTGRLWKTDKVIFPEDWEERHKVQKGDSDPLPLSGSVSYEGEFVQGALVYATYNGITISTITAEEGKFVLEAAKFGLHGSDFEDTLSIPINVDLSYLGGYDTSLTYTTEELSSRTEKDLGLIWSTRSMDWGSDIMPKKKSENLLVSEVYACSAGQTRICRSDTSRGRACLPGSTCAWEVDEEGYPIICSCTSQSSGSSGTAGNSTSTSAPDMSNAGWENGVPEVGGSTPLDSQLCEYKCSVACSSEHSDGNWYGQCGNPDKSDAGIDTCTCIKLEGEMSSYTTPAYDPNQFGSGQGGFNCPAGQDIYVSKPGVIFCVPADAPKVGYKVDPSLVQIFTAIKEAIESVGVKAGLITGGFGGGGGSYTTDKSGRPVIRLDWNEPNVALTAAHEAMHQAGDQAASCYRSLPVIHKEFCADYCSLSTPLEIGYAFKYKGSYRLPMEIASEEWYGGETDLDAIRNSQRYKNDCLDPDGMCRGGICDIVNKVNITDVVGRRYAQTHNEYSDGVRGLEYVGSGIKRNWNLPDDDTVGSDDPAISETDTFDPDRDEPASNEAVSNTDTPVCTYEEVGEIIYEFKNAYYYEILSSMPPGTEVDTEDLLDWLLEKITDYYGYDQNKAQCIIDHLDQYPNLLHFDSLLVWDDTKDAYIVTTNSMGFADFAGLIENGFDLLDPSDLDEQTSYSLPAIPRVDTSGLYEIYSAFPIDYDSETGSFLISYDPDVETQSESLLQKAYASEPTVHQIDPSNAKMFLFTDTNENQKYDPEGEQIEKFAGIPIIIKRAPEQTQHSYQLNKGLNMIAFPFEAESFTAKSLLDKINTQGGDATEISTIRDGTWQVYKKSKFVDYTYKDFPIEIGKGYFVFTERDSTLHLWGNEVDFTYEIFSGYGSVGFSDTLIEQYKTAYGLLLADSQIYEITKYKDGKFYSVIRSDGDIFGYDYDLSKYEGYFIRKLRSSN